MNPCCIPSHLLRATKLATQQFISGVSSLVVLEVIEMEYLFGEIVRSGGGDGQKEEEKGVIPRLGAAQVHTRDIIYSISGTAHV